MHLPEKIWLMVFRATQLKALVFIHSYDRFQARRKNARVVAEAGQSIPKFVSQTGTKTLLVGIKPRVHFKVIREQMKVLSYFGFRVLLPVMAIGLIAHDFRYFDANTPHAGHPSKCPE